MSPGRRAGPARVALTAVPAVAVGVALLAVTRLGATATPDSAFYVGVARSLVGGDGFVAPPGTQPLAGFPPLFPLVLGGIGLTGIDPLTAAAWLNPLLAGAIVLLVSVVLARRLTLAAGLAGGLLVAANLDLLVIGSSVLSEPLFLLLGLGSLVVLARHFARPRPALLAVSVALVAGACLTRYVGVAVVATGVLGLLHARRLREATIFAVGGLAPVVAWAAFAGGVNRPLALHGIDERDLLIGAAGLSRWVLPLDVPLPARAGAVIFFLVLVGALAVLLWRRSPTTPADGGPSDGGPVRDPLPVLVATFAGIYAGVLVVYRLVLDASARFDGRALVPLAVLAVPGTVAVVVTAGRRWPRARWGLLAASCVVGGLQLAQAAVWVAGGLGDVSVDRRGYTAEAWRRSTVVAALADLPPSAPVYSNGVDAVFLLTGRRTAPLPAKMDYLTGRRNASFGRQLEEAGATAGRRGGAIVHFSAIRARRRLMPAAGELEARLRLREVQRDAVGVRYEVLPDPGGDDR